MSVKAILSGDELIKLNFAGRFSRGAFAEIGGKAPKPLAKIIGAGGQGKFASSLESKETGRTLRPSLCIPAICVNNALPMPDDANGRASTQSEHKKTGADTPVFWRVRTITDSGLVWAPVRGREPGNDESVKRGNDFVIKRTLGDSEHHESNNTTNS
jgi:hypothetical protein